jgi:hypothetical protein
MHILAVMQLNDAVVRQIVLVIRLVTDMNYVVAIHIVLVPSATIRIVVIVVTAMLAHILVLGSIDPVAITIVNVSAAVVASLAITVVRARTILVLAVIVAIAGHDQILVTLTRDDIDILATAVEIRSEWSAHVALVVTQQAPLPVIIVRITLVTQPRIETVVSLREAR